MAESKRPTKEDIAGANALLFVTDLTSTVEGVISRHLEPTELVDEVDTIVRDVVDEVISFIEGTGNDDGYILIPQEEDLAMLPATKAVVAEHYDSVPDPIGMDISGLLRRAFEEEQD